MSCFHLSFGFLICNTKPCRLLGTLNMSGYTKSPAWRLLNRGKPCSGFLRAALETWLRTD